MNIHDLANPYEMKKSRYIPRELVYPAALSVFFGKKFQIVGKKENDVGALTLVLPNAKYEALDIGFTSSARPL